VNTDTLVVSRNGEVRIRAPRKRQGAFLGLVERIGPKLWHSVDPDGVEIARGSTRTAVLEVLLAQNTQPMEFSKVDTGPVPLELPSKKEQEKWPKLDKTFAIIAVPIALLGFALLGTVPFLP
jgi:hypothetical protein